MLFNSANKYRFFFGRYPCRQISFPFRQASILADKYPGPEMHQGVIFRLWQISWMTDGWQAGQWHTWKLGNIMNGFGLSFLNSKGRQRCIVIHSKKESKGVQSSKENKESGDALHILTKRWCTSRCSVPYVCTTKKRRRSVCLKCATRKGCTTWRSSEGRLVFCTTDF